MLFEQGTLGYVLYGIDIFVSLVTLICAGFLGYRQPRFLKILLFQIMVALQIIVICRCVVEIMATSSLVDSNAACRVVIFLSYTLVTIPLYICVFCVIYFQLVVIYNLQTSTRHQRIHKILFACCLIPAIVPQSFVLFIPPDTAGVGECYCNIDAVPNTRLFVFRWLVFHLWVIIPGIIGLIGIGNILIYVCRVIRATSSVTSKAWDESAQAYNPHRQKDIVVKLLGSIVWYPITPIVSLWFTVFYNCIRYSNQRGYSWMTRLDTTLQFLETIFLSVMFFVNPSVHRAFRECIYGKMSVIPSSTDTILVSPSKMPYDIDSL